MSAESTFKEAERKINRYFFRDYDAAQDLFSQAAARFKLEKNYLRSGEAYTRAGDCAVKVDDTFAAGKLYADAAAVYRRVDLAKAAAVLEVAVQMQVSNNRLSAAAQLLREYAEELAEQGGSSSSSGTTAANESRHVPSSLDAIPYYEKAARYYHAEDQKSQEQKCMVAMAKIYGEHDKFDQSLAYYERIANMMVSGPLRFQAQDYFLRAMLCRLAMVTNDARVERSEECQEALNHYMDTDMYLRDTREAEFLQQVIDAVSTSDIEKFEDAVAMLNDMRKLDEWKTHVLLVVKNNMESLT